MKACSKCKVEKPFGEFQRNRGTKTGYHAYCKPCAQAKNKAWVAANKEKHAATCASWYKKNKTRANKNAANHHYKKYYGVTHDEFLTLCERAGNKCQICQRDLVLEGKRQAAKAVLDHCHDTGEIRGVLCNSCNVGIGHLGDNAEALRRALIYLESTCASS